MVKLRVDFYGLIDDLSCYVIARNLDQLRNCELLQDRLCGLGDFMCDYILFLSIWWRLCDIDTVFSIEIVAVSIKAV